MEKISGYVEHIIYRNTGNGYSVFELVAEGEEVTCVGTFRALDEGENLELEIKGRHDPVIVPRAVVVVEAMAALTITDALFNNMSARMDRIHEFYHR